MLREEDVIIHDRFRVLTLANRPGFPFLGNDFFRECGTVFAAHVVDMVNVSLLIFNLLCNVAFLGKRVLRSCAQRLCRRETVPLLKQHACETHGETAESKDERGSEVMSSHRI